MHRWEREARDLVRKLLYADLSQREAQLWNNLRIALDELEQHRREEERRIAEANGQSVGWDDVYGDGY